MAEQAWGAWKEALMEGVDKRLESIRMGRRGEEEKQEGPYLEGKEGKGALERLHARFVLVSADKSENNVVVVCKRHYVERLRTELAGKAGCAPTYTKDPRSEEEVVAAILEVVIEVGEVAEELQRLATLYWTPKMHKDPVGQRFIASSRKCVTKPLSQLLSKCLKLIQETARRECKRVDRESGTSSFWIVKSTEEVLESIESKKRLRVQRVASFDFSTLYTMIEHTSLIEELQWVISFAFRASGKKKMAISGQKARWIEEGTSSKKTVTERELVRLVTLLVENIYVAYGGQVYRQEIGIPMGTDCAPFLANLYLFALEHKWIRKQVEAGRLDLARQFNRVSRYIDDLLAIDDGEGVARYWKEIYARAPGLVLKKENDEDWRTHFLDLNLVLNDGKIKLSLYDKRDDFPFQVRTFPDLSGNIHGGRAHGVLVGQLDRFAKANDHYSGFSKRAKALTAQLEKQGFNRAVLGLKARKFWEERDYRIGKYRVGREEFVRGCLRKEEEARQ